MNPYEEILRGERWQEVSLENLEGRGWFPIFVPFGNPECVAEIIGINKSQTEANTVGVRATGSILDRKLEIPKGEGGGHTAQRFFAMIDQNQMISIYCDSEDILYFLSFCFPESFTFDEPWDVFDNSSTTVKEDSQ